MSIIEQGRLVESLSDSEEQVRRLLDFQNKVIDTAVVWINLLDREGNVTLWNRAAELISGYSREEVVGHKKIWEWLYPDSKYRAKVFADAKKIIEKGERVEEYCTTIRCKNGSLKTIRWYENNILDQNGKPVGSLAVGIDVTEVEEAREKARESEDRYRSIFENASDTIVTFDMKGNVTSANRVAEKYGFKKDEVLGKSMLKFVPKKYWPKLIKQLAEISRGNAVIGEVEISTPTGKKIVEHRSNPMIQGKKVIGFQSVLRDVSERKLFEERLSALNIYGQNLNMAKNMEEIYSLILDATEKTLGFEHAGILVMEGNMLCLVTRRVKMRREEAGRKDGKPFFLRLPLDGNKGVTVRAARTGKPVYVPDLSKEKAYVDGGLDMRSEFAIPIKIGSRVLGVLNVESRELNAFDEKDQKLLEILASHAATAMSNLDHAKKLEAYAGEIRESQQRFERMFMNNPEAAVYTDASFHVLDINPRFVKLFGYSLDAIKGKHINDVVVPKEKMEEAVTFDRRLGKGEAYQEDTFRKRKDGTLVPVSFSAAPIVVQNKVMGIVAIYKDISQLKRAEEELKRTLKKLELMNEKLRVVGGLTRHDVRNKLAALVMDVYLAKNRLAADSKALEPLKEIEPIIRNVERIFDFARTYEMLGVEELVYMDVSRAFEEAVSLFSDLKGVKTVNDCCGLIVLADSLLRQVFYNLIDNSLKYGEKITRIRVYYEKAENNKLKLIYEDNGVGIPKEMRENLFKEGYGKGTGYGLYLIRKICEVYGWTILEAGKAGKGVKFTITIPETNDRGEANYRLI